MDTLLTILFFVVAAILSAIMKKKQAAEEEGDFWSDESQPTRRPPTSTPPPTPESGRRLSWEDELRRLLQGQGEPSRPVVPPSLVMEEEPPPAPPPLPIPSPSRPQPVARRSVTSRAAKDAMNRARTGFERARNLDVDARRQLAEAARRLETHAKKMMISPSSDDIRRGIALVDSPESARAAIVASVILGPPKAFQDES